MPSKQIPICGSIKGNLSELNAFTDCTLGFGRCAYGREAIEIVKRKKPSIMRMLTILKSEISIVSDKVKTDSFYRSDYESFLGKVNSTLELLNGISEEQNTNEASSLESHIRLYLFNHHPRTIVSIVTTPLLFFTKDRQKDKCLNRLNLGYNKLVSLENILNSIETNPLAMEYLLSDHLPEHF